MQNLFARSPWERQRFVVLQTAGLGQNAPASCELTAEGGQRCADGTYLPPGCAPGSPETLQGKPLLSNFPVVPVALAVAGVAAASAILMSGPHRMGAEIPAPALERLTSIGNAIRSEREADAFNFSQYQSKMKENYELLERERQAEIHLREQNRLWEATHQNYEALQAATTALETVTGQRAAIKAEAEDYRQRVDRNSQNVVSLRQDAGQIIAGLPADTQTSAWKLIDPCAKGPAMQGAFLGQVRMAPRFAIVNV
jgi:hypothetical protein